MIENRIHIVEYMRYMDDGRSVLPAFKPGWRWVEGMLCYKKSWWNEDRNKTGLERTTAILGQSMQGVFSFLRFTTEVGEGEERWLPTLDTQIRVEDNNTISYKFYEKPTTTNTMVPKRSALNENSKLQILANDLIRRLSHTDLRQDRRTTCEVIDQFGKKVLTSGYSIHQTKKIVLAGIRGWDRKVKRMKQDNDGKIFRTNRESVKMRTRKKILGKTHWYKSKKDKRGVKEDKGLEDKQQGKVRTKKYKSEDKKELETAAVLFVDNTKEGGLARNLREVLGRLEDILGYRVKVVERSGTPLKLMFPLSKVGEGQSCERTDCITCNQDSRGEHLPPCKKRIVLYENICLICNPSVLEDRDGKKRKSLSPPLHPPSIYIGESSRSLYERGKEHWRGYRTKAEDSHIYKHQQLHHGGQEPNFHLRPVRFLRTALTRQVYEAVMIQRMGEEVVLNSKGEYNRCTIGRLTLGEEDKSDKMSELRTRNEEEELNDREDNVTLWEQERTNIRRVQEIGQQIDLERGIAKSPARKRTGEYNTTTPSSGKRLKGRTKLKYPLLGLEWGLEDQPPALSPPPTDTNPPPPPIPTTPTATPTLGPSTPPPEDTNPLKNPPLPTEILKSSTNTNQPTPPPPPPTRSANTPTTTSSPEPTQPLLETP